MMAAQRRAAVERMGLCLARDCSEAHEPTDQIDGNRDIRKVDCR